MLFPDQIAYFVPKPFNPLSIENLVERRFSPKQLYLITKITVSYQSMVISFSTGAVMLIWYFADSSSKEKNNLFLTNRVFRRKIRFERRRRRFPFGWPDVRL